MNAPLHHLADADGLTPLVAAARAGDVEAFSQLYRCCTPMVRRIVRDNVHSSHDVDDVAQDVFTRAFDRLGSLRDADRFLPWLYAIARRAAIDHRRVRVAGRALPDADPASDVVTTAAGPDDLLLIRDELRQLELAAGRLSPRDLTALNLVGHLGLGPGEIATALGLTPGAAKVVVHRARTRLRALLDEERTLAEVSLAAVGY